MANVLLDNLREMALSKDSRPNGVKGSLHAAALITEHGIFVETNRINTDTEVRHAELMVLNKFFESVPDEKRHKLRY